MLPGRNAVQSACRRHPAAVLASSRPAVRGRVGSGGLGRARKQQHQQQHGFSWHQQKHPQDARLDPQRHPGPQQQQWRQQPQAADRTLALQQLPAAVTLHQLWTSLHMPAHAAAEALPPTALVLFKEFLEQIHALGPWGGALFVLTVMIAEMVPLFPTQPLTLASGLLFGPTKGAIFVVVGVTLAAINAFSLSRGVGRPLAEKVIAHEVGEAAGPVARQLAAVNAAIESGGFMKQVTAITLLRLTPVVPFSASNYLLGLTPVQLGPMVVGTVAGMSVWSVLYASLGGASRALLDGGVELDVLLADLGERAGAYSADVAGCGLLLGLVAGAYYLLMQRTQGQGGGGSIDISGGPQQAAAAAPEAALDASGAAEETVLQNKS